MSLPYLIDDVRNKKEDHKDKLYIVAAKIALKYGTIIGNNKYIKEFWNKDEIPPQTLYSVRFDTIKWYIHNKMKCKDKIWNADFLHGLSLNGRIRWSTLQFPSFFWSKNKISVNKIIKLSPFGGTFLSPETRSENHWKNVPALYLKHSSDSISYLAGVLSGGTLIMLDGVTYSIYNEKSSAYLESCGIPIESKAKLSRKKFPVIGHLVSPFWAALFSNYMPKDFRNDLLIQKNPCKANIYAPVLWRTYVGNDFPPKGIPYLQARKTIYNKFHTKELSAMKYLDRVRVDSNLIRLDNRVKAVVQEWGEIYKKENNEGN